MAVSPSTFRLTFADPNFRWAGERRPDLPILRWPDGTLCEPVVTYFGYSAEIARVRISSMKPEAYAIREWLAFLASRGTRWDEADDMLLHQWRESHRENVERGQVEPRQVERKLDIVFEFYRVLPEALPFNEHGKPRKLFVGRANPRDGMFFPITTKMDLGLNAEVREIWSGAERVAKRHTKRSTPDELQVGKILAWLRSKGDRQNSQRAGDDAQQWLQLESERNWLIARCMVDGGLRAHEVGDLTVGALAAALHTEGLPMLQQQPAAPRGVPIALDAMTDHPEARTVLLAALDALEARHRRCVYVEVIGKGRRMRMAPFTIDLMRDLLEIGVWTVRHQQLTSWQSRDRRFHPPLEIFLSFKTKGPILAATIADLMKDAFTAVGVSGSGHRLRAHYATMMAARLWDESFAMNGYRFDQTVVNMALERLAEAMGHSQVTTTVKHYLDMALLRHFGMSSRAKLNVARGVWDAVIKRQGSLSEEKMRLILKVVNGLAATPDGSALDHVLAMAVEDSELNPTSAVAVTPKKTPHLRVVDDDNA